MNEERTLTFVLQIFVWIDRKLTTAVDNENFYLAGTTRWPVYRLLYKQEEIADTQWQKIIYKTLPRKLKTKQHESH